MGIYLAVVLSVSTFLIVYYTVLEDDNGSMDTTSGGQNGGKNDRTRVVVVGAGIAGLTAASKLLTNGIRDVTVLEAQNYVGGRVQDQDLGDIRVAMGAMFIHGTVDNPVFEIINKLGLSNDNRESWPPEFYTANKEKVPLGDVEDLMDYVYDMFEEDHDPKVGENRLEYFSSFKDDYMRENNITEDDPKREEYEAAYGWLKFYDEINEGVDTLRDLSEWVVENYYEELDGPQEALVKGGYTKVVQALQTLIPEGVIRTGTPVRSIDWTNHTNGGMLVRCENGDVITADHVIVTISMGCLKAVHDAMFTPSLPSPFVTAVEKMRMGTIGKIFLKWDKPFWTEEDTHFAFLWLKSSPVSLSSDKSKRRTRYGKLWWEYVPGPQRVADHHDVLVVWMTEYQLDAIRDVSDQEVTAILVELMQSFLYDMEVTAPDHMIRTRWKENPYVRGTYAYANTSADALDVESITAPVFPSEQNPRLLFAGEAFTPKHATTVHGAFMVGERQAERVLLANNSTQDIVRVADALGKLWWEYISGPQLDPEHGDILVVWLLQHQLDAIRDVSDQEVTAILVELMQSFLCDMEVTAPDHVIRPRWKENQYIPCFDVQDVDNITFPVFPSIQNPRLLFAGESFSLEYATTVHGAFITGEQQAEKVLLANGITDIVRVADAVSPDAAS